MRLALYSHPSAFFFWPALIYVEARCSDPKCKAFHGFTIELNVWWWTLCLDFFGSLHDESP